MSKTGPAIGQLIRTEASRLGYSSQRQPFSRQELHMIILGVILLIIGFVAKIAIIWTLGIIAVVVGAILALLGTVGHAVGGRRHYY
jgi:uncharacterized membrane protein HdeD (DUF308 family)